MIDQTATNTMQQDIVIGSSIIYILSDKNTVIIPAIVLEENLQRTINGIKKTYKVGIGPNGNKIVDLAKVGGEIFYTLQEAEETLTERLKIFCRNICEQANQNAMAWYGVSTDFNNPSDNTEKIDPADLLGENNGTQTNT
jgi:hypothetical protein